MNADVVADLRARASAYCPRDMADSYQPAEVALRELLRAPAGGYAAVAGGTRLAPYRQGQVSLPDSCAAVRELETLCSEAGLQYLEGCGERMFQAGVEPLADERELRYVDPTLTKNRKSYIRFYKRP